MEALSRGHQVTAIARRTEKFSTKESLKIVSADVHDIDELAGILAGHDAVVSTFNPSPDQPNPYESYLSSAQGILQAVRKSGVKRFIFIGGAGSLILDGVQIVDRPDFPQEWLDGARAARDFLGLIKAEDTLDWTYLSPAMKVNFQGERLGKYRTNMERPVFDVNGKSEISGEDLARAIADELEGNQFIKKRFTVGY